MLISVLIMVFSQLLGFPIEINTILGVWNDLLASLNIAAAIGQPLLDLIGVILDFFFMLFFG